MALSPNELTRNKPQTDPAPAPPQAPSAATCELVGADPAAASGSLLLLALPCYWGWLMSEGRCGRPRRPRPPRACPPCSKLAEKGGGGAAQPRPALLDLPQVPPPGALALPRAAPLHPMPIPRAPLVLSSAPAALVASLRLTAQQEPLQPPRAGVGYGAVDPAGHATAAQHRLLAEGNHAKLPSGAPPRLRFDALLRTEARPRLSASAEQSPCA